MARRGRLTLEDLIRAPWYISATLAVFLYVLLRHVAPALILSGGDSVVGQELAGLAITLAPYFALLLLLGALFSVFRQWAQGGLFSSQSTIERIQLLSWEEFEGICAAWCRAQGYSVVETPPGPDGGVDLVLRKGGATTLVQCKHWKNRQVGVKVVRELLGVMTAQRADQGIVMASGEFTREAHEFAKGVKVRLVGGPELVKAVCENQEDSGLQKEDVAQRPSPDCPICHSPMIVRLARRGRNAGRSFWGCSNFPQCRGTLPFESSVSSQ